jgi:hypothetical protein
MSPARDEWERGGPAASAPPEPNRQPADGDHPTSTGAAGPLAASGLHPPMGRTERVRNREQGNHTSPMHVSPAPLPRECGFGGRALGRPDRQRGLNREIITMQDHHPTRLVRSGIDCVGLSTRRPGVGGAGGRARGRAGGGSGKSGGSAPCPRCQSTHPTRSPMVAGQSRPSDPGPWAASCHTAPWLGFRGEVGTVTVPRRRVRLVVVVGDGLTASGSVGSAGGACFWRVQSSDDF